MEKKFDPTVNECHPFASRRAGNGTQQNSFPSVPARSPPTNAHRNVLPDPRLSAIHGDVCPSSDCTLNAISHYRNPFRTSFPFCGQNQLNFKSFSFKIGSAVQNWTGVRGMFSGETFTSDGAAPQPRLVSKCAIRI